MPAYTRAQARERSGRAVALVVIWRNDQSHQPRPLMGSNSGVENHALVTLGR